jgi:hypothetical protein
MTATTIAHLKITLDDVRSEVLRRIEVPFNIRLDRLHLAIQAAMAGPTLISTRSALGMWDGACPERHKECKAWIGEAFDPSVVDTNRIAEQLVALAKRWSRKPATKRPRQA